MIINFVAGRGIYGAYFGQGIGRIALDNVNCNGGEPTLLNCSHHGLFVHNCDHSEDVSVRCILREDQRVKNITLSVEVINSPSTVHTALISWVLYNTTADEPTSFDVKCSNEVHSITMLVSGQIFTAHLLCLLPLTSYNCCVSAVYEMYVADEICTEVETPDQIFVSSCTTEVSNNQTSRLSIVGGVLGGFIVILLITLFGVAVFCSKRKRGVIPAR